ncbi:MAG: pyridoxamine 5'-phosphate oxidase family protein [Treponema sp.]|jgi:nitroimidazol reductase NimA-like FMN-containing flavoprotein (pyridoxamine 5'-phosphate oxidase superfamily)|nr:pyridoxamine 5'-phosphate oxidase family protein [Treponema sp.]
MRRTDRAITSLNDKMAVIQQCKVCRLGLSDDDQPYIVPLNYGYSLDDGALTLYFHSANEGKKLDIIRKNDKACFEIDCEHTLIEGETPCTHGFAFKSVIGFGKIIVVAAKEEKRYGLNLLMQHQTRKHTDYSFGDDELARVTVYKMLVTEFTGKQREARL